MKSKYAFKKIAIVLLGLLLCKSSFAQSKQDAMDLIKIVVEDVITDIKTNQADYQKNPAKVNAIISKKVAPYVDFRLMSQLVLAKHWKSATPQQQDQFVGGFQSMLINAYSSGLLKYVDSVIEYGSATDVVRNKVKVDANIKTPDGKKYNVLLSLVYIDNTWKAYDVSLDGVSFVTSFRGSFDDKINSDGLDSVIKQMVKNELTLPDSKAK